jgi:hypothetical protein
MCDGWPAGPAPSRYSTRIGLTPLGAGRQIATEPRIVLIVHYERQVRAGRPKIGPSLVFELGRLLGDVLSRPFATYAAQQNRWLFDHLVGLQQQQRWDSASERLRSPVVDDQLKPCCLQPKCEDVIRRGNSHDHPGMAWTSESIKCGCVSKALSRKSCARATQRSGICRSASESASTRRSD